MLLTKRGLQGIQLAVRPPKTLNRANLVAVGLRREHDARPCRFAIEQNGARAADTVLAANVGTRESEILTQKIAEQQPRLDRARLRLSVDDDGDGE